MKSLRDIRGREFAKGQNVAVAERDGNVARIRVGIIEAVDEGENRVSIRWTDGWARGAKVSNISVRGEHVDRPRIVVIG